MVNANEGWEKMELSPTWDYQEQPEFEGIYMTKEIGVGPNSSNLYSFRTANGSEMSVWGNTILDGRFKNLTAGDEVKIVYLGKVASNKVKGREYHNFEVFKRKAPMEKVTDTTVEVASKSVAEAESGFVEGLEADQAKESK